MIYFCSHCNSEIIPDDINIKDNIAMCKNCNSIFKVTDLINKTNKKLSEPPKNVNITAEKILNGGIVLKIENNGFKASNLFILGFNAFWLIFVAFWTFLASKGSVFFALFSIPFWLVGIYMALGNINNIFEKQIIKLEKREIVIEKLRPFKSKKYVLNIASIQKVQLENINNIQKNNFKSSLQAIGVRGGGIPIIICEDRFYTFGNFLLKEGKIWLVSFVDNWVENHKDSIL